MSNPLRNPNVDYELEWFSVAVQDAGMEHVVRVVTYSISAMTLTLDM